MSQAASEKDQEKPQQSKFWSNPFGFSVQLPSRNPGQSIRMQFVESLPFGHKHQLTQVERKEI